VNDPHGLGLTAVLVGELPFLLWNAWPADRPDVVGPRLAGQWRHPGYRPARCGGVLWPLLPRWVAAAGGLAHAPRRSTWPDRRPVVATDLAVIAWQGRRRRPARHAEPPPRTAAGAVLLVLALAAPPLARRIWQRLALAAARQLRPTAQCAASCAACSGCMP
jgi:hypothetical protein